MEIQTFLAVIGIFATLVLGVWAIVIAVRYSRNVRITYAQDQVIALTDDISQNFADLKIYFRDQPVSDNLVLLKGYLINTGRKDISHEMIEENISLRLPDGFEWVECKVVETSPSLKAKAIMGGKGLISIETGLWKAREYLKFEALAKVPVLKADPDNVPRDNPTRRLAKSLGFSHRIADSRRIEETRVPRPSPRTSIVRGPLFLIVGAILVIIAYLVFPEKTVGCRMLIDGEERVLAVDVTSDTVQLTGTNGYRKRMTVEEFHALPNKEALVMPKKRTYMYFFATLYGGLGLLTWLGLWLKNVRERRFLSMITGSDMG